MTFLPAFGILIKYTESSRNYHCQYQKNYNNSRENSLCFLVTKIHHLKSPLFCNIMKGRVQPMQLFVNFSVLIIFALWIFYEIRKSSRIERIRAEKFWEREQAANLSRKTDISGLDYITIPLERLPMDDTDDSTINSYRDTIHKLADQKIVNLTSFTNTDLKMKYGASNLAVLTEYDNNYLILVSTLNKWGERLYHNGCIDSALAVFEFAVMCLTDVRRTYELLARIYVLQHTPDKIDPLLDIIPFTNIVGRDKLMEELLRLKNS